MSIFQRLNRCAVLVAVALLVSCATTSLDPTELQVVQEVDALQPIQLERICIEVNPAVGKGLTEDLFDAMRELGFATQSRQGAFSGECRYWMSYTATWAGFPNYLATAEFKVYEDRKQLGHIRYDARKAGNRPDRYGSPIGKLQPLLEALFVHVERPEAGSD
jgi:hypothetical protein